MKRHFMIGLCLAAMVVAGTGIAQAGDWVKLGNATLMPSKGGGAVKVKDDAEVSKLMLRVSKEKVMVRGVKVVFEDGKEKAIDVTMKLRPGVDSDTIEIGKTGTLTEVHVLLDATGASASSRAPVKVFGA
jgi:hypothetical protein